MEVRFHVAHSPQLLSQVGRYALSFLAVGLLYKIYQIYTAKRWTEGEIGQRILKKVAVEDWRRTTFLKNSSSGKTCFEKDIVSFKPGDKGSFIITRPTTGETIYEAEDPKNPITAATYKAGQIFIARGKEISWFDLVEQKEVRHWLQVDHEIINLSFDKDMLYAVGLDQTTVWDLGRVTEPDIIERLLRKILGLEP